MFDIVVGVVIWWLYNSKSRTSAATSGCSRLAIFIVANYASTYTNQMARSSGQNGSNMRAMAETAPGVQAVVRPWTKNSLETNAQEG